MIHTTRRHPWMLWTDSICPAFSDKPVAKVLSGSEDYTLELDFEYDNTVSGIRKELFAIVPFYTGVSIVNNEVFVGVAYKSGDVFLPTGYLLDPTTRYKLILIHKANKTLELFIGDNKVISYDLTLDPLNINENTQMFLGSGLWPEGEEEDVDHLKFYELKISTPVELIAHHKFEEFIHSKSIDLTGNCNFLFKLR